MYWACLSAADVYQRASSECSLTQILHTSNCILCRTDKNSVLKRRDNLSNTTNNSPQKTHTSQLEQIGCFWIIVNTVYGCLLVWAEVIKYLESLLLNCFVLCSVQHCTPLKHILQSACDPTASFVCGFFLIKQFWVMKWGRWNSESTSGLDQLKASLIS